jgi:hypothetical protein
MRIYLAGPMRGQPLFNFPAFFRAAMALRDDGHFVDNPAERDMAVGFNPACDIEHPDNIKVFNLKTAFEWDFEAITNAQAIVLLPGWEASKGVQAELVLALALKRDVYQFVHGILEPLDVESYQVDFAMA